ncbi:MAG: hypothetical protein NTY38_07250 [Acidobacteria bacterium]|nr:hypothetical protein [Acidobacteriota bacterium]
MTSTPRWILVLFAAQTLAQTPPYFRGEPLRIGNQVQLLTDDYAIEDRWKLTREVGKVLKYLKNPVVARDKPWEGAIGGYPCVLYDQKTGKFRMYYDNFSLTNYFTKKGPPYYIGYAESVDGINWTKPELEGFPFGGHERTNVISTGPNGRRADAAQVMLNPDQSDPKRRYMMMFLGTGVRLAYSADGIHWDLPRDPLFRYHSDFPNHLVHVPEQKLWFLYVRPSIRPQGMGPLPEGIRHTGRRLALSTSPDLKTFSAPRTVLYPDERDEPDYDNVLVFRRHGLFIAMHSQMEMEKGSAENQVYLATSRDGIHWERTWNRQPFIPRGPEGSFDHGQVEIGTSPPVEVGEEMLFYYYASPTGQKSGYAETSVGMARMRKDRFIGQWAGEQTGYLMTRQFVVEGSKLVINCTALPGNYQKPADGIRVAVLEAPDYETPETMWETAVPGFTLEDCDNIITDNTAHTVTWKKNADLGALKGKAVYLRFQMKKAGLYSFQIAP